MRKSAIVEPNQGGKIRL